MEIVLALMSMLFLATYEILYKIEANKGMKSENIFINTFLFSGIFKVILVVIFFLPTINFNILNFIIYIPNILFDLLAAYLFIKSIKRIPIFLASTLYLIYYPFSILCSVVFLHENITFTKVIAIVIIGIIIFILSFKKPSLKLFKSNKKEELNSGFISKKKRLSRKSRGVIYALVAGILNALYLLLDKNCLNNGFNPNEIILYNGIGSIFISVLFYYKLMGYFKLNKNSDEKDDIDNEYKYKYMLTPLLLGAVALRFFSSVLYTIAMSFGNVSTVIPIIASDVIIITIVSSIFLHEKIKLYQKILIVLFVFCIAMLTI